MAKRKNRQVRLALTLVEPPREKLLEQYLQELEVRKLAEQTRLNQMEGRERKHVRLATILLNLKISQQWTYRELAEKLGTVSSETIRAICSRHTYLSEIAYTNTIIALKKLVSEAGNFSDIEAFLDEWGNSNG